MRKYVKKRFPVVLQQFIDDFNGKMETKASARVFSGKKVAILNISKIFQNLINNGYL